MRGLPLEAGLAIAGSGATEVAGLLEVLPGDGHARRGEEALRRALVVALRREDRPGGLVVAGLQVQLGGFEEAILVVADAGRAHEVASLDEIVGGRVERRRSRSTARRPRGPVPSSPCACARRSTLRSERRSSRGRSARSFASGAAARRPGSDGSGMRPASSVHAGAAPPAPIAMMGRSPSSAGRVLSMPACRAELLDLLAAGAHARIVVRAAREIEPDTARADQGESREQDQSFAERANCRVSRAWARSPGPRRTMRVQPEPYRPVRGAC